MTAEDLHIGVAGSSTRHQAERLRLEREQNAPGQTAVGRARRALFPSPKPRRRQAQERAWRVGAEGEERLATFLGERCREVLMLHDRAAPMSRANIDHIAIAPSGVYVIDCKRYRGKIEVTRPLFGPQKLKIKGRDRTSLIAGLERQVAHVKAALAIVDQEVPVHGCLCFVAPEGSFSEVGLPIIRTLLISGYPLYDARRLSRRLNRTGPIGDEQAAVLQGELAERLPPALHTRPR